MHFAMHFADHFIAYKINIFGDLHVLSQPARDAPGTTLEGRLKILTCGTSRRPSGDS